MKNNVIYREINELEGYLIGSDGSIKNKVTNELIRLNPHPKGYVWKSFYGKNCLIHTLVAKAFPEICGEYFPGAQCDHINTIRNDNRAENIRVVSVSQNHLNPITRKRMSEAQKGKIPVNCKPVERTGKVLDIFLYQYPSAREAERAVGGKGSSNVSDCCNGKRKTAYGYRWQYVE